MRFCGGELVKVRGSSEIITTDCNSTSDTVKKHAVEKHMACNSDLPSTEYELLYPDGCRIETLPGSNVPFTICAYKQFIKKPYQKLKLYICPSDEYIACE